MSLLAADIYRLDILKENVEDEDRPLKLALEELRFFSAEFRLLGVYPASKFREGMG